MPSSILKRLVPWAKSSTNQLPQMSLSPVSPNVPRNTLEYQQYQKKKTEHANRKMVLINAAAERKVKVSKKKLSTPPVREISPATQQRLQRILDGKPSISPPKPTITFRDTIENMRKHYELHPPAKIHPYDKFLKKTVSKNESIRKQIVPKFVAYDDSKAPIKKRAKSKSKSKSKSASKH